jgi:hypothetical protein
MTISLPVRGTWRAAVLCALLAAPAAGQERPVASAELTERPLVAVVRELTAGAAVDVRIDPAVANRPVAVDFTSLSLEQSLKQVLLASGADFVMAWKNGRLQVLAGDLKAAVDLLGLTAAEPRAVELDSPPDAGPAVLAEAEPVAPSAVETGTALAEPADRGVAEAVAGAGAVTGEQLIALLAAPPRPAASTPPPAGMIELPFTDAAGRVVRVPRPAGPSVGIQLPFTDDSGQPVVVPNTPRTPGAIDLPFPDEFGRPIRLVPGAAATPQAPRPPGQE